MAESGVFVRKTSGLRRDWSVTDLFIYNWMTGNFIFTTIIFPGLAQILGSYPGTNTWLAITIGGLFSVPMLASYALLAASMPRSGGDYVWISRIIHPSLGFAVTVGLAAVFAMMWMPWNGWNMAYIGLGSGFGLVGSLFRDAGALAISEWSKTVLGTNILMLISIVLPTLFIAFGLKVWAWIQRFIFVVAFIAYLIILGLLFAGSRVSFIEGWNGVIGQGLLGISNYYQQIISTAHETGMRSMEFSWYDTGVWMAYMAVGFSWNYIGANLLGEVKRSESVRNMVFAFVIPPIMSIITFGILFVALYNTLGQEFMVSLGYLMASGNELVTKLPFMTYFCYLPAVLVPMGSIAFVVYFIMIGLILMALFYNVGNILIGTRYYFAQAFDRILPTKIAYVNERWGTPTVALLIPLVGGLLWWIWATFQPEVWLFLSAAGMAVFFANLGVCLTAIAFPYRQKMLYESSPVARFKIGGVPLVVLCGIVGTLYSLVFAGFYLGIPALGATGYPPSYGAVIGIFVGCIVWYFAAKEYRKRQGIDVTLAFKEIPPL